MQLQNSMAAFNALGIRVYALSYDEQEPLADFAKAHGITYRLLSDPDSTVIRQFGILNTIISEDDHPWFGIPYPGTYLVDGDGQITHKFFENNLAVRVGPEQLLRAFRGESQPELASGPAAAVDAVSVDVFLDGDSLALSVQRDLVAHFVVPSGSHLYASPAPEGMVAVAIELDDNPLLVLRDVIRPPSETHQLAGTAERFEVHHGVVELRLPVTINGTVTANDGVKQLTIAGTVCWQACDDAVCELPDRQRFEIAVPVEDPALPQIRVPDGQTSAEPRAAAHFAQMIKRRER